MKNIKKLYQAKGEDLNQENFHESVKDHAITVSLVTTNFNKTIGFLCPVKLIK